MSEIPDAPLHVPTLAIIGVGLIGGSLALALKRHNLVGRVIGVGRSRPHLQRALTLGVIDEIAEDAASAARQADIIMLATPVNAIKALLEAIAPALEGQAGGSKIIADVGSVKVGVCQAAAAALGAKIGRFVPCHPVAGKEHSGVESASADLFDNHNVVLTPSARTDAHALEQTRRMWVAVGARVILMPAEQHDRVLSLTSHLPHVLAYAMVDLFAASEDLAGCYDMAAGGFYDFTRIASSDAEMWRDICLMNREQILAQVAGFSRRLERIKGMLDEADGAGLQRLFGAAKHARSRVAERRTQPTGNQSSKHQST